MPLPDHLSKLSDNYHAVSVILGVHGVVPKWNYIMRTIESVESLFQPLEDVMHQKFIPALTGQDPCCKLERDLLSLPSQLGGLNIHMHSHPN